MDDSSSLRYFNYKKLYEYPLMLFYKIEVVIKGGVTGLIKKFFKITGINLNSVGEKISKDEIRSLVELGEVQGAINQTEKEMICGIIKFEDILAKEVMTPRTETFCIEADTDITECIDSILEENYSRIPIYQDEIDNIVGILYMKDLFASIVRQGIQNVKIRDLMRKPYIMPEINSIDKVMREMQQSKNFMAILMDEYGGFSGIVTLEDLVEEVIGDIWDEYDDNTVKIKKINDTTYIVSGLVSISEINRYLDLQLKSDDIDTIGGYLLEKIGSIPEEGTIHEIDIKSVNFKILSLDDKRIDKIQITKM